MGRKDTRKLIGDRLRSLKDAVNWKVILVLGMAVSLLLCLSHVYRFMKGMGM